MTKVYTRGGDKGKTHLVGGERVEKDALRVSAYGDVDELSAVIGVARIHLQSDVCLQPAEQALALVADELFTVGSEMATPVQRRWEGMQRVGLEQITRIEGWIDDMSNDLPPLKDFILPGGGFAGAQLHLARTVCRRAERGAVRLNKSEEADLLGVVAYLNRLSDFLFVLARWVSLKGEHEEVRWNQTPPNKPNLFRSSPNSLKS